MDGIEFQKVSGADNVEMATDDKFLYFRLDRTVTGSRSASGKTQVIATTRGNQNAGNGLKVGLNVYHK